MRIPILLISALVLAAQERERPRGGFGRMNPLVSALDTDGDGAVSAAERAAAPQALRKLDRNGDGQLTAAELRPNFGGGQGRGPGGGPQDMAANLMRFDKNGDGVLDPSELPERMQGLIARGDRNGDGKLTRDEIAGLAQAQPGGRGPGGDPALRALDTDADGTISSAEIASSAAALSTLDRNGDGILSGDEIRPAFGPGGPRGGRFGGDPAQMAARMIGEWDQDGDGKLSKSEAPDRMRDGFDGADLDHDGKLSPEELGKMMQQRFGEGRNRKR